MLKPVLPSLREKKRYISCDILPKQDISFQTLKKEINSHLLRTLGEIGHSKAGIQYIQHNKKMIIRTSNKELTSTRAALMLINKINNKKARIKTAKISGILKKLKGEK